ncbi:MAG TPA: hypothetical protein VH637_03580 [Streptosporangiaceae bacterium]|jgi:hypothetical protein
MTRGDLLAGLGTVLVLAGIAITLHGLGAIGGSSLRGATLWAVAGPVIAVAGQILVATGFRSRSAA